MRKRKEEEREEEMNEERGWRVIEGRKRKMEEEKKERSYSPELSHSILNLLGT